MVRREWKTENGRPSNTSYVGIREIDTAQHPAQPGWPDNRITSDWVFLYQFCLSPSSLRPSRLRCENLRVRARDYKVNPPLANKASAAELQTQVTSSTIPQKRTLGRHARGEGISDRIHERSVSEVRPDEDRNRRGVEQQRAPRREEESLSNSSGASEFFCGVGCSALVRAESVSRPPARIAIQPIAHDRAFSKTDGATGTVPDGRHLPQVPGPAERFGAEK